MTFERDPGQSRRMASVDQTEARRRRTMIGCEGRCGGSSCAKSFAQPATQRRHHEARMLLQGQRAAETLTDQEGRES